MAESIPMEWWRYAVPAPRVEPNGEPTGGRLAFWCLVAFTVVLFVVPQQYFPVLYHLRINLQIALLAIAAHLFAGADSRILRFPLELKLALALVVWSALTIPGSWWPGGSVDAFIEFLKVLAIFWLLGQEVCSRRRLRIMFWTFILTTVPLTLTGIQNFRGGVVDRGRIVGFGNNLAANPNDLALSLNLFIPFALALALSAQHRWQRLLAWGIAGLCAVGVILTFSRGGFLTLGVIALLGARVLMKTGKRWIIAVGAIAAVAFVLFGPAGYMDRMRTIVNIETDETGSAQMRLSDTEEAIDLMFQRPILGAGFAMGTTALNEARGAFWTNVHNAYLNYGVDTGIPGFLLFAALVIVSYRSARQIELWKTLEVPMEVRTMATGVRISLVAFAVAAVFHPVGYDSYFYYLSGMAVALKTTAARQFSAAINA